MAEFFADTKETLEPVAHQDFSQDAVELSDGKVINASGHVQEVNRNFGLLSIAGVGIVTGCMWPTLGSTIVIALYNGGPPGVIYEFIVVFFFYCLIAASLAELASAVPSSAGVYHWATITAGPKWGKVCGWYAGWWNFFAWLFGCMSISAVNANIILAMWGLYRPDYVPELWHVYIVYLLITWVCCFTVIFGNKILPKISEIGLFLIVAGVFITILCLAILPSQHGGYATNDFVWKTYTNNTGYSSAGFSFVLGMLNGAFAVGTPDVCSHLAEELPRPRTNIPKAVFGQYLIGFLTTFTYLIALFYSISDFDAVLDSALQVPVVTIYQQGTGSRGGAIGLTLLLLFPLIGTLIGDYITAGRMLWTLARDDATPFSKSIGAIHPKMKNPAVATAVVGVITTLLGLIYVGSDTAFNAFVGSFAIFSSISYAIVIIPHLLTGRKYIKPGPFYMKGALGYIVGALGSGYIVAFTIIYCFPLVMPFDATTMNYSCVLVGGLTLLVTLLWFWKQASGYTGPKALLDAEMRDVVLSVGLESEKAKSGSA